MVKVIGVRFKKAGKIYDFDAGDLNLVLGEQVLVETARGTEVGQVALDARDVGGRKKSDLKKVLRLADEQDFAQVKENADKGDSAMALCREKADALGIPMRPVDTDVSFDGNKITIFFEAENRVDFRELVRELASALRARIEFRQIGVRDAAKMLGGLGPCGRPLCCTTFMTEFRPVSIRMAKEQNLALNPVKISGLCGRLMCCLRFEMDPEGREGGKGAGNGNQAHQGCCGGGGGCPKTH